MPERMMFSKMYNKEIPVYSDNVAGCKEFLATESTLELTKNSTFEIDQFVKGCWCVHNVVQKHKGGHVDHLDVVIWMAGYPDPFGEIREMNDFECAEKATHKEI